MSEDTLIPYAPTSVAHPGEIIGEYLEARDWSQRELARRTELTPKTVSEICARKANVSPSTALALEKVLGRPAHFWLALQRNYDEAQARTRAAAGVAEVGEWARGFPIAKMREHGWIEGTDKATLCDELLSFFAVASPSAWRTVWSGAKDAYRQTQKGVTANGAVTAWLRAAELQAGELPYEMPAFDEGELRRLLDYLRLQTRRPSEECIEDVQKACAGAGVIVVWVPELPQIAISGIARWLQHDRALIGLTLRYKTDDQMWFTFFHELGHVLLHRRQHPLIVDNAVEDITDMRIDPAMRRFEEEANRFAADTLIRPNQLTEFLARDDTTHQAIRLFAEAIGVSSGIVVNRLQQEGILGFHEGNSLKQRFRWQPTKQSAKTNS